MNDWISELVEETLNKVFLKENPDRVSDENGNTIARHDRGTNIGFIFYRNDESGKLKHFYIDGREYDGPGAHYKVREKVNEIPGFSSEWSEYFSGRIWVADPKDVISFYRDEGFIMQYADEILQMMDELGLDVNDFRFNFEEDPLIPWPGKSKKSVIQMKPEDEKRLNDLLAKMHLVTGVEREKIEKEIEAIYTKAGIENAREKTKAAYRATTREKEKPYYGGYDSLAAGRFRRTTGIAENDFLKEDPTSVVDNTGHFIVDCQTGPAVAFVLLKNRDNKRMWFYNDKRSVGAEAWHQDIERTPSSIWGFDVAVEVVRGRLWSEHKICSFYQPENIMKAYTKDVEDFFDILGEDITEYRFDFRDSAYEEGLKSWIGSKGKTKELVISPQDQKKIAELMAKMHLVTGVELEKVEKELDALYKKIGIENAREKSKAAYRATTREKEKPYYGGYDSLAAGQFRRTTGIAEEKFRVYNKTLCPELWTDDLQLDTEVRNALLKIAMDFYKDTELRAEIQDVYLLGSAANYNWTSASDLDIHILIDSAELAFPPEYSDKFFRSLSSKWNLEHDVKVKGHKVEIYLQDIREKNHSTAVYSLAEGEWIKKPTSEKVEVDKDGIQKKYTTWTNRINDAIKQEDEKKLRKILEDLRECRQAGLDRKGEFSTENLVFKVLRARGWVEKIKNCYNSIYDKKMTVKEFETNEGFDPTSVGPNPDASEGLPNGAFYQSEINRMRKLGTNYKLGKDNNLRPLQESLGGDSRNVKGKYFSVRFDDPPRNWTPSDKIGIVYFEGGDEKVHFANTFIDNIIPKRVGKWVLNRHTGAFKMELEGEGLWFDDLKDLVSYLDKWYEDKFLKEGYGGGIPEKDRLKIGNPDGSVRRWQIRSKDAPKTPKMDEEELQEMINEILDKVLPVKTTA